MSSEIVFRSGWGKKERSECFYIVIMLIPFVLVLGRMVGLKNCCNFSSFSFGLMLDALSSIKKVSSPVSSSPRLPIFHRLTVPKSKAGIYGKCKV